MYLFAVYFFLLASSFGFVFCDVITILYVDDKGLFNCNQLDFPSSVLFHSQFQQKVKIIFATKSNCFMNFKNQIPVAQGNLTVIEISKVLTTRSDWFMKNSHLFLEKAIDLKTNRYFIVNDIMTRYGLDSVLVLDSDQFIYGQLHAVLPILKQHYPLAALPQTSNQGSLFAGVFWISRKKDLAEFTDYLLDVLIGKISDDFIKQGKPPPVTSKNFALNVSEALPSQSFRHNLFVLFVPWVRRFACCKAGGIFPDERGLGIKPNSINEMTFLAHYHHLFPSRLRLLPTVPLHFDMPRKRNFFDLRYYACGGVRTGIWNSDWIWDTGAWGATLSQEYTMNDSPRDLRNIDIIEHAISQGRCKAHWTCRSLHELLSVQFRNCSHLQSQPHLIATQLQKHQNSTRCIKVPAVSCSKVNNTKQENLLFNIAISNGKVFELEKCAC